MVFPSYGSWISATVNEPSSSGITSVNFVAEYVLGSSIVEYAIYDTTNTTAFTPYTTATNGSNSIAVSGLGSDYRFHFRMVGYPSLGFNPKVVGLDIVESAVGATLLTKNLGSDIKLPTTLLSRAFVALEGSYYWLATGSVSTDNGSSWTGIPLFGNEFEITSNTGSEAIIKISDSTGSVVITKISGYFHTSDIA